MKQILKPIALNESSFNVRLLHKILEALGLPVSRDEVTQSKAGEDTLKKVRTLQRQLDVAVDESILVDEATALAITEVLDKRGLTAASRSFTVTGTVRLRDGKVKKRQQLLAFDLDLPGVAVYRDIENLSNIQKNSGFEFLGQTTSDNRGNYRVTFYDWQYGQAERKKADVVAYALEGEEIIGRSRLVNSEDYSDKGLVRDLDVIVTQEDARTEYDVLMTALTAFLKESKTSLAEIATSRDQLIFTAGELDIEQSRIDIVASSELLAKQEERQLSHELLYGIGRQSIRLSWAALFKKHEEELRNAIAKSVKEQIISEFGEREITDFLKAVRERVAKHMLDDGDDETGNTLNALLKNALPEEKQRLSFVNALRDFKGSDYRKFWNNTLPATPEFEDKPELISDLLLTQQLTLLTANHQALVNELRVNSELKSMHQLFDHEKSDWVEILRKTGVPDFIEGENDEDKIDIYADMMQGLLNATFPTQRIAKMLENNELHIEQNRVSKSIGTFLANNDQFDFAASRIHDFDEQIKSTAGEDFDDVRSELMKMQRVFQVSASPKAMTVLIDNNLGSAYSIANIPRKSFIKTYSKALGSEREAFIIHERASHISLNAEMNATHLMEYSHGATAAYALGKHQYREVKTVLENQLPNYTELFGSPDICECKHCRSVYSPAAYLVDLLRFLWRGESNSDSKTPLDMLDARRPDLAHMPLTCENTNILIPYIDLVNEVMEHYVANDSLLTFEGYDTGETTAEELRANPQNFNLEAYGTLNDTKYPFTLPYHQPLDVIRTYGDHLRVSRYEVLKAMNPQPDVFTTKAIEAESLSISHEEYTILTGEDFDSTPDDPTKLHEYFGYTASGQLEDLSEVPDFLQRTGLAYTDLVELVKTLFINPYQDTLDFLQKIFSYAPIDASTIYTRLEQIEAGTLDSTGKAEIEDTLNAYSSANGSILTFVEFEQWVTVNLSEFRQVMTLYEPDSKCNLDNTQLRTIQSIYESSSTSGITDDSWSKIHRFIRLWRKLGWSIHETDLMLAALGDDDITTETISKLESISLLKTATRRPLNQLAVLWGNIDTYGDKSLYRKLFLNKAVQEIDQAFKADEWGNYLHSELDENNEPITLAKHQSAILAAFRIREADLDAILKVASVIDGGNSRLIDINTDILNLHNLSTLYRYVVLAKGLKMRVTDLCKLIDLFSASPFSIWDTQQAEFSTISPADTYQFYKLATSTREAGFKPSVLEYIFQGTIPADSTLGLDKLATLQTGKAIRDAFAAIEQDHPETAESPLTSDIITAKLSLTFQPEIVSRFMEIVEGTPFFETVTDTNLDVAIPDDMTDKYTYSKGSGRLTSTGIVLDTERVALKLANANANFQSAVDELYSAPETFLSTNFNGVFSDLSEVNAKLLDHPAQAISASLDDKFAYVYEHFVPVLKSKLRQDAISQHIAALIGLSEEATSLLIAEDVDTLITELSTEGFSATYFNDATWTTSALEKTDGAVDFAWGIDPPDPMVPAENFSVRWKSYLAAPASGEYTLVVEVEEADESFKLYLDAEILEKPAADTTTTWEIVVNLNATQMHQLTLEYAEISQNAGIRLYWKTATSALEIIPSSAVYPAAILDDFVTQTTTFHRTAKFILGFEISETELDHFMTFIADFGNIDFRTLAASDWERIRDYTILQKNVHQAQALLTDVFALANRQNPVPTVNELTEILYLATAWDEASLKFLVDTHFVLSIDDFKNEIALNRLYEAIQVVRKTGISAETLVRWGTAETDFDVLHDTAQLIKRTVCVYQ